jgi:hypothetical protein
MRKGRGTYERETVPHAVEFIARTSSGQIAYELRVNGDLYQRDRLARVLREVEHLLLDALDPPLGLVVGDPQPRPLPPDRPDDPYHLTGPRLL